ncbi:MAG: M64 family metallopeptidase [Candidatus Aminicenantales bacterium]
MKRVPALLTLGIVVGVLAPAAPQTDRFHEVFTEKTLRIDIYHTGKAREETVTLDRMFLQGAWAGNPHQPIDRFNNGRYYVKVYDQATGALVFSRGFDSYFGEYKTTEAALKGVKKTFHESVLIPYPKKKVRFVLEVRDRKNILHPLFTTPIDPSSIAINTEPLGEDVEVIEIWRSDSPSRHVDVAVVAEGYTKKEADKVRSDLEKVRRILFSQEPYASHKERFNIYGVFKPSEQSGCDEPRRGIYRNTALGASFNSLGSERYLLTEDNRALRDVAAHVPYDTLVIMVNHKRYGGGGIYNLFCTFTVDNQWNKYLFLHEFGHSFAGLGDEYYTSSVAYSEFYPPGVEPIEPNLTAFLDPANLKWKALVTPGVALPTPWEKEGFDRMDEAYQKVRREINAKIAAMKCCKAPEEEIEKLASEAERLSRDHAKKIDAYLAKSRFQNVVGAFEGAGYASKGLYRPMLDCLMFTKGDKPYCRICEQAIMRVMDHYTSSEK